MYIIHAVWLHLVFNHDTTDSLYFVNMVCFSTFYVLCFSVSTTPAGTQASQPTRQWTTDRGRQHSLRGQVRWEHSHAWTPCCFCIYFYNSFPFPVYQKALTSAQAPATYRKMMISLSWPTRRRWTCSVRSSTRWARRAPESRVYCTAHAASTSSALTAVNSSQM